MGVYQKIINKKEFEEELKRIKKLPKEKICPVCKKKLPKKAHHYRKYHKECSKIAYEIIKKLSYKKPTKEQNERINLRDRIKRNTKNPSCSFCQGNKCVKNAIKFDDFRFYPKGGGCSFKPRDKCPNFKPKYPKVYNFIIKNKLKDRK